MMAKKPDKIDVEWALSERAPKPGAPAAEGEIEIVEVVGGEPGVAEGESAGAEGASGRAPAVAEDGHTAAGRQTELAAQNAALVEHLKRLQAEYENFHKRVERDRAEQREQANAALVLEILPALDSLERALGAARGAAEGSEFRSGVELIQRQFLDVLGRAGLQATEDLGRPFDPEQHEAVAVSVQPGVPAGRVLQVFDRGYRFRGRLLRPARVRVSADAAGDPGAAHTRGSSEPGP